MFYIGKSAEDQKIIFRREKMKKTRITLTALGLLILVLLTFSFASCSDEGETVTEIKTVEIDKKGEKITVKATLDATYAENHSKDTLYLLALPVAGPDGSLEGAVVVGETRAKKSMTFKFELYEGNTSHLTDGFVLAEVNGDGFSAITDTAYISNPEVLASSSKGANATSGIKGLATEDIIGAGILGAEHFLLDARIDSLMLAGFERDAIAFNCDGITYYFDKSGVEELDSLVSDASAADMRIYIRTTLGMPDGKGQSIREPISFLYCDGAKGALGYLPDLSDPDAARYVTAFYAFIADRYPVSDFIIGDSVNNYAKNCNAGKLSSEEFEILYAAWARTAHTVLSSINSSATVYIPIDNAWRIDGSEGHIGAKVFLSRFAESAKAGGDYPYAISLDLGNGDDLSSLLSGEGYDYASIGVTNLSELSDLIDNAEFRYKSEKRRYIIGDLTLSTDISEENRAAYYTYAYYSAAQNGFDAFISSSPLYSDGVSRSDLYYSVLMCGSSMSSQLSEYTDKLKNVHVPDFDSYKTLDLFYAQTPTMELAQSVTKNKKPFPLGFEDFSLVGSAFNSQGEADKGSDGELSTLWLIESDSADLTGAVSAVSVSAKEITGSAYIGITMSSDSGARLALAISNESDGAAAYSYVGEAKLANAPTTYYFDISEFSKGVNSSDTLSISLCLIPDGEDEESVEISDISLYGSSGSVGNTATTVIFVVAIIGVLVALIAVLAINRKKKTQASDREE